MHLKEFIETRYYKEGMVFVIISFVAYLTSHFLHDYEPSLIGRTDSFFDISGILFYFNFLTAIIYFIRIWKLRLWANMNILLVLLHISCWSVNIKFFKFFSQPVGWLNCLLVAYCINLIAIPLIAYMPRGLRTLMCLILGSSLSLFIYFALYLSNSYVDGLWGLLLFGIGIHVFTPAFLVIHTVKKMYLLSQQDKYYKYSIVTGIFTPIMFIFIYLLNWGMLHIEINTKLQRNSQSGNSSLPNWIYIAQNLPTNFTLEPYLKSGVVYPYSYIDYTGYSHISDRHLHEPLVVIADHFLPESNLDSKDKEKVLDAIYIAQHKSQERPWTGENIETNNITNNITIWPEQRIAFTEKTIAIKNKGRTNSDFSSDEAIYTFHIPEGGVISSFTLWIDGKESKGIIITDEEADTSENIIDSNDKYIQPIVTWQGGNTVSVKISPGKDWNYSKFKLGITAPLTYRNGRLKYQNISFEGPNYQYAQEIRQIQWVKEPNNLNLGKDYKKMAAGKYLKEGYQESDWAIEFVAPKLQNEAVVFNGFRYTLEDYHQIRKPINCKRIYLDLNNSWSTSELEKVLDLSKNKKVYIFNNGMKAITKADISKDICKDLLNMQFSLFPFHLIAEPSNAMVISKSKWYSPTLNQLIGSEFGNNLSNNLNKMPKCNFYNLGTELTTYLRTLKEYRAFEYESGDMQLLEKLLKEQVFSKSIEDSNHLVIDIAHLALSRTPDTTKPSGNENIMRLFVYNHIISQLTPTQSPKTTENDHMLNEAIRANVVSPISSLGKAY